MRNALRVHVAHRGEELLDHAGEPRRRKFRVRRAAKLIQVPAGAELFHDEHGPLRERVGAGTHYGVSRHAVEGYDVGVVQGGQHVNFTPNLFQIRRHGLRKYGFGGDHGPVVGSTEHLQEEKKEHTV